MTSLELFGFILGWINTAIATVRSIPQIVKIIRFKSAVDVSWMSSVIIVYSSLWIAYGAMLGDWQVAATSIVLMIASGIILKLKYVFRESAINKTRRMMEREYLDLLVKQTENMKK